MNSVPFFSIVIPVYNRASILLKTLSTILKQTFKSYEVIIVDDGSTENVNSVLNHLIKNITNIKIIRQENKERGAARNFGLKSASGMYVIFFDSDDLMHEDHLQVLHDNIKKENYPDYIATKFNFIDESGKQYDSDMNNLQQGYYDYHLFLSGNPLACNICVKRNNSSLFLFEEDRKYSIKEDWMFLIQNLRNQKLFIIDKVTITMFDHNQRSMRSGNNEIVKKTHLAYDWIVSKIKLPVPEEKVLKAHVNYFSGIHAYLDSNKKESINYSMKAISEGGIKIKYLSLLIKSIIGRKLINKLK
jgi:glycosyltransferase involved in cell wall biosynthesis